MAIVKKRCIRCRKELREDGTCQNPACVRYVPESEPEESVFYNPNEKGETN